MKKKINFFLMAFIYLVFLCFTSIVYANENCKLYIGDITKYANSNNVVVNIYMENVNKQITTLGLNLEYDTSKLKFISSKAGKDLHATVKLAENVKEKGKVSIAALAVNGLKSDGLYYSINFQVLDDSTDIPIKLSKKEIADKDGNDISVETQDTFIKISKETTVIEKSPQNQKIEKFDVLGQNEYNNLDEYIQKQGKIKVLGNDILVYETEKNEIAEIQDDGTIIPIEDGTTNVRVKLNNDTIGNVIIEIENKKIKSIIATDEKKDFQATACTQDLQAIEENIKEEKILEESTSIENSNEVVFKKNNNLLIENKSSKRIIIIVVLIIVISIVLYISIKNNR